MIEEYLIRFGEQAEAKGSRAVRKKCYKNLLKYNFKQYIIPGGHWVALGTREMAVASKIRDLLDF